MYSFVGTRFRREEEEEEEEPPFPLKLTLASTVCPVWDSDLSTAEDGMSSTAWDTSSGIMSSEIRRW